MGKGQCRKRGGEEEGGGWRQSDLCVFVFRWLTHWLSLYLWFVCHCYEVFLTQWGAQNASLEKSHVGAAAGVTHFRLSFDTCQSLFHHGTQPIIVVIMKHMLALLIRPPPGVTVALA